MTIPIPRFRGKAIEKKGGWGWEFIVSFLGSDDGECFATKDVFKTKNEALADMKLVMKSTIQFLSEHIPEINPETYIDMKTNSTRRWDKSDEH